VAQVKNEQFVSDDANWAGQQGQQYLAVGGNQSKGKATTAEFALPADVSTMSWFRMGGADAPSGVYVKLAEKNETETVCKPTSGGAGDMDTNVFFETSCDVSSAAGKLVYLEVSDEDTAESFARVIVDDIHFMDRNGNILGNHQMFWKKPQGAPVSLEWQLPHPISNDFKCTSVVDFGSQVSDYFIWIDDTKYELDLGLDVNSKMLKGKEWVTVTFQRTSGIIDFLVDGEDLNLTADKEMDGVLTKVGWGNQDGMLVTKMNCEMYS